ncbi:ABC transporter ATP-binding protein [Rhodoplanes sp. SY1]|uniref:ABC transporter ATP-binding protein n=1 Tax=Rhodoplanes sp. SY1 TaxID=3166646 RepID=UPI0038B485BA
MTDSFSNSTVDTSFDPATRDRGGPAQPLLSVRGLVKHFGGRKSWRGVTTGAVRAVDGVDFDIAKGETLGVVGESGCGKSTTARLVMQIIAPDAGEIVFDGEALGSRALDLTTYRREVQMVFQDSYASLNPRLTVEDTIAFGPRVHGVSKREAMGRAHDLLFKVGLEPARFAGRYPHELSGGQRQRINIARALALQPRLVILDEAVSALDKSVEAQVLNLLLDLKAEFGLTYMFISHDLNVVRFMADRVMVMYLGRVAEVGPSDVILKAPSHPYTGALLASMPSMDPDARTQEAPLSGDPPNPIDPPPGCRFHTRCRATSAICAHVEPALATVAGPHQVACLMAQAGSGHPQAAPLQETAA